MRNYRNLVGRTVCAMLRLTGATQPQEHRWARRTLDELEWPVHERLAALPMKGAFETLNFEVQGSQVTLSGQVLRESLKEKAESAVREVGGVTAVVNRIEVLPQSKRDDVLRMNVYRAIYEKDASGTAGSPQVHIIRQARMGHARGCRGFRFRTYKDSQTDTGNHCPRVRPAESRAGSGTADCADEEMSIPCR